MEQCSEEEFNNLLKDIEEEKQHQPPLYEGRERAVLDEVFFRRRRWLETGSERHKGFAGFYEKYRGRWKNDKGAVVKEEKSMVEKRRKAGMPGVYHPKLCRNFFLDTPKDIPEGALSGVTNKQVNTFNDAVNMYEWFNQKKSFMKLKKMMISKTTLPASTFKPKIVAALAENTIVIIAGDTGCGKSTQIPQYFLEAGYKNIAVTQPRRLAAISLAKRVADELVSKKGNLVGYQVRFDTKRNKEKTKLTFLTEGILMRYIISGQFYDWDVVVVDEVHERSLTTDFLLGCLKTLHQQRPFKWVLMSATINIESFQEWISSPAPIPITIPGRTFPVTLTHLTEDQMNTHTFVKQNKNGVAKPSTSTDGFNTGPYVALLNEINAKHPIDKERGDVLIFVPGVLEIEALHADLRSVVKNIYTLPLHAGLEQDEQDRIFKPTPEGVRKVVLSTNIAETSITVNNIRFVLDSGRVKIMKYDQEAKISSLQETWVSKASAKQRMGRAGRTAPGHCYRLYSESEFNLFTEFTEPEIKRTPLTTVLLQIMSVHSGDVRGFPFIDKPSSNDIEASLRYLVGSGCATPPPLERLTPLGTALSALPVDIDAGKLIILGAVLPSITDTVLSIAAAMSVQSIFHRTGMNLTPGSHGYLLRHKYDTLDGDWFTFHKIFTRWCQQQRDSIDTRKWCRDRYLNENRLREVLKIKKQYLDLLKERGLIAEQRQVRRQEKRKFHRQQSEEVESAFLNISALNADELLPKDAVLLKAVLGMSQYDNLAVVNRATVAEGTPSRMAGGYLRTLHKDNVHVHPSSVHSDVKLAEQMLPTECLVYQKLLETHKLYLLNTTKAPFIPLLLLGGKSLDIEKGEGTSILVDYHTMLTFNTVEALRSVVKSTLCIRRMLDKAVGDLVKANVDDEAGLSFDDLPQWVATTLQGIARVATTTLPNDVRYFLTQPFDATVKAVPFTSAVSCLLPPTVISEHADVLSANPALLASLKTGRQVPRSPFLWYGSLLKTDISVAVSISVHTRCVYRCKKCGVEELWNAVEVAEHEGKCH
eukprot:TRINITY_DN6663_c2_g1_i1.p1 TRINITY_DN6663_c2_g1~~TRINITY_DN6663_c2_g1_i1.p1  ORF type:complete len:1043 (+),score=236.77 TRINITY_DN6663_c2_g1_i1:45-3173(+)